MITLQNKAWMAGVIDLKGRVINKNNQTRRTRQTVLIVETKAIPIVRHLCALTGTNAETQEAKPLSDFMKRGCNEHCPEQHVHVGHDALKMPPIARWTITGAGMVVILSNLLPYLCVDQGYEVIMQGVIENTALTGQGSGAVLASLKRLDALGWDIPTCYTEAVRPLALAASAEESEVRHDLVA